MNDGVVPASFRDPSGFVFTRGRVLFRQVNQSYAANYRLLMESGLYQRLVAAGDLISHEEVGGSRGLTQDAFETIQPEPVSFVSYPYEWSFSQLKDAALATLRIQKQAVEGGMILKDASAYNIQFHRGRPILIDTLSFDAYYEGEPWAAYGQFCRHFLAPLALMSRRDVRLSELMRPYLDGVPLDLAAALLPFRTWLNPHLLTHLRLHARYQSRNASISSKGSGRRTSKMSKKGLLGLIDSLESAAKALQWRPRGTEWVDYYDGDSYSGGAADHKKDLVKGYLEAASPSIVWDLGANTGAYSRIAAKLGANVIAFDLDPACVERNYLDVRRDGEARVLPLCMNLVNPSPGLGWHGAERDSLLSRGPADTVMALALVHHLAISHNVPLSRIASFFADAGPTLILEFVPKTDPKVQVLLASRKDIFPDYHEEGLEEAFAGSFRIERRTQIPDSRRTLYLFRRLAA